MSNSESVYFSDGAKTHTGVLVAISIPIFTSQLEKSKEATDAANIRAKYAEMMADALPGDYKGDTSYQITTKQGTAGWQTAFDFPSDLKAGETAGTKVPTGGTVTLTWTEAGGPACSCKLGKEGS